MLIAIIFASFVFASHSAGGDVNEDFLKVCRSGEEATVRDFLEFIALKKLRLRKDGTTLHEVIARGRVHVAKLLIDSEIFDVNAFDDNDRSPLQIAVECNFENIVERLLQNGASVTAVKVTSRTPRTDDCTPLELGARYGNEKVMSSLLAKIDESRVDSTEFTNDGTTLLRVALTYRNVDAVWALVKAGCDDAFTPDELNFTLHSAAKKGGEGLTSFLLTKLTESGMDSREVANEMTTLLRVAWERYNEGAICALVKAGCDVFSPFDDDSNSSLHSCKSEKVAELLLEKEVPLEGKNEMGQTPFHRTVMLGYTDVAAALLEAGADIDAVDVDGNSAIHGEVESNERNEVEWLALKGANLNVANFAGMKPLDICNSRTGKVLIEYGADIAGYDPAEMIGNFWKCSILKSSDETFDDFVMRVTDVADVNGDNELSAYAERRMFALYRVLKAMYAGSESEKPSELENRKSILLRQITTELAEETAFREWCKNIWRPNFQPGISSQYFKWKIERLSFYLALKAQKLKLDANAPFTQNEISRFIGLYI